MIGSIQYALFSEQLFRAKICLKNRVSTESAGLFTGEQGYARALCLGSGQRRTCALFPIFATRPLVSSVLTWDSLQLQQFQTGFVVVKPGTVHLDDSQRLGPVSMAYI